MNRIITIALTLVTVACQQADVTENRLSNREGYLNIVVCSRGCYQYVLDVPDLNEDLFPVNLNPALRQEAYDYWVANQSSGTRGFPVLFSGIPLSDYETISTPAPNDVPIPQSKARKLELTDIRRR